SVAALAAETLVVSIETQREFCEMADLLSGLKASNRLGRQTYKPRAVTRPPPSTHVAPAPMPSTEGDLGMETGSEQSEKKATEAETEATDSYDEDDYDSDGYSDSYSS
ncbi:hypothetical protein KIPB_005162, partial [Kipferlia bialata]